MPPPTAQLRARRRSALQVLLLASSLAVARGDGLCARFGPFIEGAAVGPGGGVFAVNADFQRNAIGRLVADGCPVKATVTDRPDTELNGLRVLPDGRILAADQRNSRLVLVAADGRGASTYCEGGGLIAANDLALTSQGLAYVSGQRWTDTTVIGDGGVWLCRGPGQPAQQLAALGRTNGIEVSPDDKWLYVSEAFNRGGAPVSNVIWRYALAPGGGLGPRSLHFNFTAEGSGAVDVDGMRADRSGALYVTRHRGVPGAPGGGAVVVLSPGGAVVARLALPFSAPTNLELGGPRGTTLFVVGRCGVDTPWGTGSGCVVTFERATPGRAWTMLQAGQPKLPAPAPARAAAGR
ncbi:gnl [Scenedesmus sp. PABB004]|nr:gnl [Scenedesmus sp. PABB004]